MNNKIKSIFVSLILIIGISCSSEDNENIVENSNFIATGSFGSENARNSNRNEYVINIDITNPDTKQGLPTIVHKFIASDTNSDISDLREKFSTFNGTFERTIDGKLLSVASIVNGNVVSYQRFSLDDGDYECSLDGITTCADDTINDMNWIEYGACALTAPACLARIYASCIYENCTDNPSGPGDL